MKAHSEKACRENLKCPEHEAGEICDTGVYFRNLQKKSVANVYSKTSEYGQKLKGNVLAKSNVTNLANRLEISVNEKKCVGGPRCSIAIQRDSNSFRYVWEIDLERLNELTDRFNDRLVAQYAPEDDNCCHYNIVSENGVLTITSLVVLIDTLALKFPPVHKPIQEKGKQPPDGEENAAREAKVNYGYFVALHDCSETNP